MAARTPQTRKAKGRKYQQEISAFLTECGFSHLSSTPMGMTGTDIQDPLHGLPWYYTETKHLEKSPTLADVAEVMRKKKTNGSWCFFTRQSRKPTLAVMPLEVLQKLLRRDNERGAY